MSGTHFNDEELLTYVRHLDQDDDLWYIMHQHIASCSCCSTRIAELKHAEQLLTATLSRANDSSYPSITNAVMQRIYAPKPLAARRFFGKGHARRLIVFPVAVALVLLSIIILEVFLLPKAPTQGVRPVLHLSPTATRSTRIYVTQHPKATPTVAAPVVVTDTTSTAVVTPIPVTITLRDCTSHLDQVKQRLHICGYNFIAGDKILFILVNSNGKQLRQIGPVQVQKDGTFSQNITIHSCKDVPYIIYAQDISTTKKKIYTQVNINYGTC